MAFLSGNLEEAAAKADDALRGAVDGAIREAMESLVSRVARSQFPVLVLEEMAAAPAGGAANADEPSTTISGMLAQRGADEERLAKVRAEEKEEQQR
eukprot:gene39725-10909_t